MCSLTLSVLSLDKRGGLMRMNQKQPLHPIEVGVKLGTLYLPKIPLVGLHFVSVFKLRKVEGHA